MGYLHNVTHTRVVLSVFNMFTSYTVHFQKQRISGPLDLAVFYKSITAFEGLQLFTFGYLSVYDVLKLKSFHYREI